jgi:membrane-associated progesterone receptor component
LERIGHKNRKTIDFVEIASNRMQLFKILIAAAAGVGALHAGIKKNRLQFDRFMMGIFRDIGRFKARKRRHANSKGLILSLISPVDPMQDLLLDAEKEDELNLPTYTKAELKEFGDGQDGRPILISLFGRVYDVTAGEKFYGPDGPYGIFAGHDVTYSLSTGCRTLECVETPGDQLKDEKLILEGKRWLAFFHLHDKYPLVGKLESDYLEIFMDDLIQHDGGPLKPPVLQ